jgi:hypothetical protein
LTPNLPDAKSFLPGLFDSRPSGFLRTLRRVFHAAPRGKVGAVWRSGQKDHAKSGGRLLEQS